MNPIAMRLVDYAESFLAERDVSDIYRMQIRLRCRMLCDWSGRDLLVSELTCDLVNRWLANAKTLGLSAFTVHTYRANVQAVWNAAYLDGLTENPPLRLRKIKRPQLIVEAYTHSEIIGLLNAAGKLRGCLSNGNCRATFWKAFIRGAYDTGLRRGDLLAVRKTAIQPDGTTKLVQSKTQRVVVVRFTKPSIALMRELRCRDGFALPWPGRLDSLVWAFRRLRKSAGITRGSLKWIRRSAASYAEKENPGAGSRLLGHRGEQVFRTHYEDHSISRNNPFQPPPLEE